LQLSKISFEFREKSEPSSLVSSVAADMQVFQNPAEYLTGPRIATINQDETLRFLR
jgi:hypothetical protein